MLRWLFFVLIIPIGVPLAIAFGLYHFYPYWLPLVYNPQGPIDQATLREMFKPLAAAIATMAGAIVASIVTAGTAIITAGMQRDANLKLEERKGAILKELADKNNDHLDTLEERKNVLAAEFGVKRKEFDDYLDRLKEARELVSDFRFKVGTTKLYGYDAKEIGPLEQKMTKLRDSFKELPQLWHAWADFYQKGYYLCERTQQLKTATRRRELWAEKSQQSGLSLGVEFGNSAETVLTLLSAERERATENFLGQMPRGSVRGSALSPGTTPIDVAMKPAQAGQGKTA